MKNVCSICGKECPPELVYGVPKLQGGEIVRIGYCEGCFEEANEILDQLFKEVKHEVSDEKRVFHNVPAR